ncbi:MAG: LamG domain-containing protein, partial [Rhodoluna sp.]|nr:LamG domain-containing protein [Rhodoluna sp.]
MKTPTRSLTSRTRKLVIGLAAVVTASLGFAMTPQVTFAATPITPSDYYATFDGASTYTESNGVIPTSGDFTVEAWVYENGKNNASGGTIISQGGFYLAMVQGNQGLRVGDSWSPATYTNSNSQTRNVQLPANQWVHLAAVKSGTGGKLFVNGIQVSSIATLSNPTSDVTRIGRMWSNYGEYWKGSIDEVKVFNTDRSASITTDMNSRVAPNTVGLLAYYDFNEGSGKTAFNVATAGAGQGSNQNIRPITSSISYTDSKTVTTRTGNSSRKVVTFTKSYITSNGGWAVPAGVTSLSVLTVGGGGGGGANYGGGGGAGGFKEATLTVAPGSVQTVTVGFGGRGGQTNLNYGQSLQQVVEATNGGSSVFGSQSVSGGGYGMSSDFLTVGSGGSGGGGTLGLAGGSGTSGQGNTGGSGASAYVTAGGGGGAGAVGANGSSSTVAGGAGGIGKTSSITGTSTYYAGGGGGGTHTSGGSCGTTAAGGSGGGGAAGTCITAANSVSDGNDGTTNLGGGGGGGAVWAGRGAQGGNGGTGVVIVSYLDTTPTAPAGQCDSYSYVKNIGGTNYTIVEFQQTGSCTWTVPTGVTSLDMLAVGAGGGGGNNVGAGGSGGGSAYRTGVSIAAGTNVTVVVGAGGAGGLINQSGSNGGDSSINWTGNGVTTVGGGGLGGKTIWSNGLCGGGGGAVYNAYSSAGGAAGAGGSQGGASGAGSTSNGTNPTNGANGYTNSITGDVRWYAGGGGGASWGGTVFGWPGTYGAAGAPGGTSASATAIPNTGSGGGAGGDGCGNGTAGASGTVILRYVATNTGVALAIDRNAIGAPTTAATNLYVQPKVSIRDGSGNAVSAAGVTVTASGTGVGGVVTAVTDSSGVATFTGIQVTSSTTSITFSAPNLSGISHTLAAPNISSNLTISTSASSGGYFDSGIWMATTDNTATTLNTTDLQTALAAGDVVLPSKAAIAVSNSITTTGTCGNLTFAATGSSTASISFAASVTDGCTASSINVLSATNITTSAAVTLQTAKATTNNLVLWADTDRATTAGGYITFAQGTF